MFASKCDPLFRKLKPKSPRQRPDDIIRPTLFFYVDLASFINVLIYTPGRRCFRAALRGIRVYLRFEGLFQTIRYVRLLPRTHATALPQLSSSILTIRYRYYKYSIGNHAESEVNN
jgi:hypothetical protein